MSACCTGSQGARDCIKRHKTTTIDSVAREHTGSCGASRQGDSDHLTFCSGESNSTSQLGRGHPTGNRVYSKGDNTSSSKSQPTQILCRQDQPVHIELEGTHRSLGNPNDRRGIHHPTQNHPSATILTTFPSLLNQGDRASPRGDPAPAAETSSTRSTTQLKGLLFQHVHGPQEGRKSETCHQSETAEQICEIRAFQDGGTTHSQSPHSTEQLDGKSGPERCLLHGSNCTAAPASPSIQNRDGNISLQVSTIQPVHSPQSIHQSPKTSHRAPEVSRHSSSDIHGRHAHHGSLQRDAQRACVSSAVFARESWLHCEQQEISAISLPGDRVPWNDSELPNHGDQTSRPDDQKDQAGSSPDPRPPLTLSPGGVPAVRETERYQSSVADGTSLLSSPADLPQASIGTQH